MRREYRLGASPEEALSALRDQVGRARARIEGASSDALDLKLEEGRFTLVLGPDRVGQPAALIRGELRSEGPYTRVLTSSAIAPLRPGIGRATARELAEWAVVIAGVTVLALLIGLRTVDKALTSVLRWSLLFLSILGARIVRRALRRRRDQAELLSLVEGAFGPLLALPEGSPFRTPALGGTGRPETPP